MRTVIGKGKHEAALPGENRAKPALWLGASEGQWSLSVGLKWPGRSTGQDQALV